METIEMTISYAGAPVNIRLYPELHVSGTIYPAELEGNYAFTIHMNEDDEWSILREPDGTTPVVDNELLKNILKNLQLQLRYAA